MINVKLTTFSLDVVNTCRKTLRYTNSDDVMCVDESKSESQVINYREARLGIPQHLFRHCMILLFSNVQTLDLPPTPYKNRLYVLFLLRISTFLVRRIEHH